MKTNILITALLALSTLAGSRTLHAQGSLTPPAGPPTATSHTINEVFDKATTIEGQNTAQTTKIDSIQTQVTNLSVRRPLIAGTPGVTISANGTINVSSPGSYYLTNNKLISSTGAHGIQVTTSDVTIDLNGFALQCGSGTGGSAIYLNHVAGARQVRITNGFIRGGSAWNGSSFTGAGWTNGISGDAADVSISDVTIVGMRSSGIYCSRALVSNCVVSQCGEYGFSADVVNNCRALKCAFGIKATSSVDRSEGESVHSSTSGLQQPAGIWAPGGAVTNSYGYSILGCGISADFVSHSRGTSNSLQGVYGEIVDHCIGSSSLSSGIYASMVSNSEASTSASGSAAIEAPLASYCIATHSGGGVAIDAENAIGCISRGGSITAPQKSLGTP